MIYTSTSRYIVGSLLLCFAVTACSESEYDSDNLTVTQGLSKGQPGAAIGDIDYCTDPNNLCDIGEGACGRHSQCMSGLKCAPRGDIYGFPDLRVCVPAHCVNSRQESHLGEVGVDCGGECGPCEYADQCYNGTLDADEEAIDCGGTSCEPCADVVLTVNSPTEDTFYTTTLTPRVAGYIDTSSPDQRGNRRVSFMIDGVSVGDTLTTSNGSWSFRLPSRPPGTYTLSTTVENSTFSDTDQRTYRVIYNRSDYSFGQMLSGGKSSSTAARTVEFGPDESIFTAGVVALDLTYGSETVSRGSSSGIVGYVSRAAADGTPLWIERFASDVKTSIDDMKALSNGDVVVLGEFRGTIDLSNGPVTASGSQDVFLMRLDGSTGQIVWAKTLSSSVSASVGRLAITANDDIIFTSNYTGTVNLDGNISVAQGSSTDMYVARLSADGSVQWSNSYGDDAKDTVNDVDVDSVGNIYLVGSFEENLTVDTETASSPMTTSSVLIKLTASGKLISLKKIGGDSYDAAVRIAIDPADNVVISGIFAEEIDFNGTPLSATDEFDIFLASYDSDGTYLWSRQIIAELGTIINLLEINATGNIIAAGPTFAPINLGGGLRSPAGRVDGFLAIYTSNGELASQRFITSNSELTPRGLAISHLNSYAIVGDLRGTEAFFGGAPIENTSRRSGFLTIYR